MMAQRAPKAKNTNESMRLYREDKARRPAKQARSERRSARRQIIAELQEFAIH